MSGGKSQGLRLVKHTIKTKDMTKRRKAKLLKYCKDHPSKKPI